MTQYPELFKEKFTQLLKEEASPFFSTYTEEKTSGLRINPLKVTEEQLRSIIPYPLTPVSFCSTGYYYSNKNPLGKHPLHLAGLYYIQEPSAMVIVEELQPKPGDKVLDLCAAPGGKTTHIAGKLKQTGFLLSNEIHPKRVKALSENVERIGITNSVVTNETPEKLASCFPQYFDRVLVDAPCSGEGMFRKDENAQLYWSEDLVTSCAKQQLSILNNGFEMLKPGGVLVYSTCTFSPEENEQVIEAFLKSHTDAFLLPTTKKHGIKNGRIEWTKQQTEEISLTARLWPHCLKGEGHFIAKIQKKESSHISTVKLAKTNIPKQELALFETFTEKYLRKSFQMERLHSQNGKLFFLPEDCPSFDNVKVIRYGIHLGEWKKNRFEPNHAFAMSLQKNDVKFTYELQGDEWKKYVQGETILTSGDRGWLLITYEGFPLGWGKEAKGTIKNYYPKGLRIQSFKEFL